MFRDFLAHVRDKLSAADIQGFDGALIRLCRLGLEALIKRRRRQLERMRSINGREIVSISACLDPTDGDTGDIVGSTGNEDVIEVANKADKDEFSAVEIDRFWLEV